MKKLEKIMDAECMGWALSSCCGASIILGDICKSCGEHCDSQCIDCDDIDTCGDVV